MTRAPTDADMLAFVRTHGDETWFLAPVLESSRCPHGTATSVPWGDATADSDPHYPCEDCLQSDLVYYAEYLHGEGIISFDSTNTYLEHTP